MTLGETLRDAREDKGLTQEKMAAQLHVRASTVSDWERDVHHPTLTHLRQLSDRLDIPMRELRTAKERGGDGTGGDLRDDSSESSAR